MIIVVVVLAVAWVIYMIPWMLAGSRDCLRTAAGQDTAALRGRQASGVVIDPSFPDEPAWSRLDDVQLTRLLISAAPPAQPRESPADG